MSGRKIAEEGRCKNKNRIYREISEEKKICTYYTEMNHTNPIATVRQPSRSLVSIQVWLGDRRPKLSVHYIK